MFPALLLSREYEPIRTISWQRAVSLFSKGKVEILESYDGFVRSTTVVFKMPAVVRLLNAFKRNKKVVKFSRINLFGRDNYTCQYCGEKYSINELTFDHVIPRTQGGKTCWENIATACHPCNRQKGGRTPDQAKMTLLKTPVRPRWSPAMYITFNGNTPDAWRDYLYWTGSLDE